MKEILFRGKTIDEGKWVFGNYIEEERRGGIRAFICEKAEGKRYEVNAATVGQYIGFEDKNGTKVFEGDKVTDFGSFGKEIPENGDVYFDYVFFAFSIKNGNDFANAIFRDTVLEVIGNIYENE